MRATECGLRRRPSRLLIVASRRRPGPRQVAAARPAALDRGQHVLDVGLAIPNSRGSTRRRADAACLAEGVGWRWRRQDAEPVKLEHAGLVVALMRQSKGW